MRTCPFMAYCATMAGADTSVAVVAELLRSEPHPPMKASRLTCLGVGILLVAGCASPFPAKVPPTKPSPAKVPSAHRGASAVPATDDLLVISAVYGSGTSFADVTDRVREMIHEPTAEFFVRPEWLHADPTPYWNKALVIVYEFKGKRHTFTRGEGGGVSREILIQEATK